MRYLDSQVGLRSLCSFLVLREMVFLLCFDSSEMLCKVRNTDEEFLVE